MQAAEPPETPAALTLLLENHRAFLKYLERRVGDRALAEDILQDAFAKVVDRPEQTPTDDGVVPWFYRTLRNAAIDQFRRRGTATRAIEAFAHELGDQTTPAPEMEAETSVPLAEQQDRVLHCRGYLRAWRLSKQARATQECRHIRRGFDPERRPWLIRSA